MVLSKGALSGPLDLSSGPSSARACDASGAHKPPPRVAFCLSGAARGFAAPLVLRALHANLVMPLAGPTPHASGSRLFLGLKLVDSAKRAYHIHFNQHISPAAALTDALRTTWLSSLAAEVAIINGSGALDPRTPGLAPPRMHASDNQLWQSYRATPCTEPINDAAAEAAAGCCRKSSYLSQGNNEERLIHQHLGLAWCAHAIERFENKRRRSFSSNAADARFEVVVFARPDLIWWRPLRAWCDFPIRTHMQSCDQPGCDMAWVAPRRYLRRLMGQADLHRNCADTRPVPHGTGSGVREIATCCATSEWLLWYAQSRHASTNRAMTNGLSDETDDGAEITRSRENSRALRIDGTHLSLLRETENACEMSLSVAYNKHAKQVQSFRGMSKATGSRLRSLFGVGNISACRQALEPWAL